MSKFFVVATPIGNLGDITFRAVEILKNVDFILCEDTRTSGHLFKKYSIEKPTISFHAHSKGNKYEKIFSLLEEGKDLALVSDAGTPGISDPGALLVSEIKTRFKGEVEVIPIPGASAIITALSASGLPTHAFVFLGFLPHKKGRETLFKEIGEGERTYVFYESTHRILKTLESLVLHAGGKKVCLARELTKIHEEFLLGTAEELLAILTQNPIKQKGEFTVIIG